jgi:hypothetical protein
MLTNQEGGRGEKHIQDNTNNNQKLAVASMLAAIVNLLPTDQFGIILLIFSKHPFSSGRNHKSLAPSHVWPAIYISLHIHMTKNSKLPKLQLLPSASSLTP